MSGWVYIRSEGNLFTVGFYAPDGKWHTDSDHDTKVEAGKRVSFLNGNCGVAQDQLLDIARRVANCECLSARFKGEAEAAIVAAGEEV